MRTAIVTDTNSGMQPSEALELGVFLLPMPIIIDDRDYLEYVNLTHEEFYAKMLAGSDIHTSQPAAGNVMDLWRDILKEYDQIVHIPMSSGLSGSCQSAMMYAEDFDGKVQVVNNQRISVTQRQSVLDAKQMADDGADALTIKKRLEETKFDSHIYIMVDTLKYLKKGGRVTPAAAAVATVLQLKPVLQIQGEKLDAFAKVRGVRAAKKTIIKAVMDGVEKDFGGFHPGKPNAWIGMAYTHNLDAANVFKSEVEAAFPGYPVHMDELPLSIATHIGPGSLAATCTAPLPEGVKLPE